MEAIYFSKLMEVSINHIVNGVMLKRNVVAGKTDQYGEMWVLVETTSKNTSNTQWLELNSFKIWLNQSDAVA